MRNPFRRRNGEAPGETPAPSSADPELLLRERARSLVVPGFHSREDVVEAVADHLTETGLPDSVLEEAAVRIVGEEWSARQAELDGRDEGDYARLERAFGTLEADGILARMNFACCQSCGTTEIDDERTPARGSAGMAAGKGAGRYPWRERAYTFFHAQDSERLADPEPVLHLSFSSFVASPDADPADVAAGRAGDQEAMRRVIEHTDAAVGRDVVAALVGAGLTVTWEGTSAHRIAVHVPEWRKALPA